ncbi:MAG: DUF983 domain-containing protein [Gemmatimonadaceae bacterium]
MPDRAGEARMRFQGFSRSARLFARALTLRCPHCGSRGVLASWFKLAPACPRCRLRFERGESDYFLGGMMFNIALAEGVFVIALVTTLIVTWPRVPWSLLEYGTPAAMILAPVVLYPFSRLVWLAFDLMLRPVVPTDLAPSAGEQPGESTRHG